MNEVERLETELKVKREQLCERINYVVSSDEQIQKLRKETAQLNQRIDEIIFQRSFDPEVMHEYYIQCQKEIEEMKRRR